MSNPKDFNVRDTLKAIKDFILGRHESQIERSKELGIRHGKSNEPKPKEPVRIYIEPIISFYGVLWSDVKLMLGDLRNDLDSIIEWLKERADQLNKKIGKIEQEIITLEDQLLEHKANFPWALFVLLSVCLCGVLAAEVFYNAKVFSLLRQNLLVTSLLAIGISCGMAIVFRERNKYLKAATTKAQKAIIIAIWVGGFTTLFVLLGLYRNEYVQAAGNDATEFSVLLFVLINWILLIAADFLLARMPNTALIKAVFAKRSVVRKIRKLQAEMWDLQKELESVLTRLAAYERDLINLPQEEHNFEKITLHSMKQSVAEFMSENKKQRTDGECALGSYDYDDNPLRLE